VVARHQSGIDRRSTTAKASPHLPLVQLGRIARLDMVAQRQEPQLVRALKQIFVIQASGLGHWHGHIVNAQSRNASSARARIARRTPNSFSPYKFTPS
jgi:hypothetical protein